MLLWDFIYVLLQHSIHRASHEHVSVQERSQTVEAQLAETTKQLHDLRVRQKQLEARNALLEKVAKLNQQTSCEPKEPSPSRGHSGELWSSIQV